ncbi:murein hydrolase activator EnvC family protein [Chenggangzhangella methanolivorans]|uniref:murein hydrolase activator EnvC family protein n=1 Tax=Chenggangzhangella methanolivorans TaxID=1437009 RepID=UPI0021BD82A5|nr:peptidoglycan DD-metalloendopeptidase family protein [Chenggangzhangella methanolivorans]
MVRISFQRACSRRRSRGRRRARAGAGPRSRRGTAPRPRVARQDLKAAEERRQAIAAEIEALKGERGKLQESLASAVAAIRTKEPQVEERSRRIGELAESERQLKVSLAARRGVLADVIAALQRMGRQPPPALLVRPNDALEAVRSAMLLGAVVPDMRAEAEALGSDLRELVRLKGLMTDERDALAREILDLGGQQERLAALVEERQRQSVIREHDLQGEVAKTAELVRGVGDLEALIAKMEKEQAARAAAEAAKAPAQDGSGAGAGQLANASRLAPAMPFEKARGLLPLPVSGKRIHGFGDGDGGGGASKGVSISASPGAPVTAPCDGWVVYAGPFRSYGQLLILNAGGGYHVLLAGMERISVALNQFVLAGEPVATMRGAAAGPARPATTSPDRPVLYVEFRKDRGSIDPSPWWAAGNPGEKVGG